MGPPDKRWVDLVDVGVDLGGLGRISMDRGAFGWSCADLCGLGWT